VFDGMIIKKTVLFHGEIVKGFGGAERVVFEILRFFKKKNVKAKILTFRLEREPLKKYEHYSEIIDNVELVTGKNRLQQIVLLRRRLLEINPDVVIGIYSSILFLATLFTGISYIVIIHGTTFWSPGDLIKYAFIHRKIFNEIRSSLKGHLKFIPLKPKCSLKNRFLLELKAFLDYLGVQLAEEIIVVTERVQWEVKKLYGRDSVIADGCLDSSILTHSPNENVRTRLNLPDRVKIILTVSRLESRKRLDLLIRAFVKVTQEIEDVILVIVGSGGYEIILRNLAKNLDCSEKVIFVGFVDDNELWDYFATCDIFAFPGWTSRGLTLFEALAFNKKVVLSSEGASMRVPKEVFSDPHMFLAEPEVDAFAETMKEALTIEVKTKIDLSKYTWDKCFERIFKALI